MKDIVIACKFWVKNVKIYISMRTYMLLQYLTC